MTKRLLFVLSLTALLGLVVGCSDDDDPVGPGTNPNPPGDTTYFDATADNYVTTLTAKGMVGTIDFSAAAASAKILAPDWDLKFEGALVNTNGGVSAEGGDVYAFDLGVVTFADVTAADSNGVDWEQDEMQHIINEWYFYNFQTHQITMSGYVYTLTDAEGDNFIEMTVDSVTGGGQPPAMGTVWFSYYYNPTADDRDLSGAATIGSVEVTQANGFWGYFDFSAGAQVFPANASTSSVWDIGFNSYELFLNSGPNGPGSVVAFPMHGELNDPTSLEESTSQPVMAPMFEDYVASIFNGDINDESENWYNYNGSTHELTSKAHVYLIKSGAELYKMRIESYYRNVGGVPTSGYFTLIWDEL